MKSFLAFLITFFFYACASSKEIVYVGSTPAHSVHVRDFLGISLTDSIDFIRWKLVLNDNDYKLQCEYGIGKPNTSGFIDRKEVNLTGRLNKENNFYYLHNGNKTLGLLEVNTNLLHLLNADKKLLAGTGGWSYTLNNTNPKTTNQFNFVSNPILVKDSIELVGRTPCQQLSASLQLDKNVECKRLKWSIVLYTDASGRPTGCRIKGTAFRNESTKEGNWKIVQGKNGRFIYQLEHPNHKSVIYLVEADENILFFTDAEGNLLVGNEDFSYTLNRRQ